MDHGWTGDRLTVSDGCAQLQPRPFYSAAGGFLQMYIMAALEPQRYQLQVR
jgi:hypothetical protein